jgi:hypothetical protein
VKHAPLWSKKISKVTVKFVVQFAVFNATFAVLALYAGELVQLLQHVV